MATTAAEAPATAVSQPTSHPKGFWFFFWGEFAERCSYYGMMSILALYIAEQLRMGDSAGVRGISLFKAGCYFLPLLGGFIADRYFGKYWTIVGFSIPYILGHVIIGYETVPALIFALCLLAMGSGVIKPNISTLMGMTYEQQRPGQDQLRSNAFAYFYLAINIGAFLSQAVLPSVRTQYDYWVAFLVPAGLMVVSFIIFAAGKPHYAQETIVRKSLTWDEVWVSLRVVLSITLLFLPVVFFWAIFDQSHSVWIYFARDYLDLTLLGMRIDPDQMQAINPFMIMALVPLMTMGWNALAARGIIIRPTTKMLLGFFVTAGVLVVLIVAAQLAATAENRNVIARFSASELTLSVKTGDVVRDWRGPAEKESDTGKFTAKLGSNGQTAKVSGTFKVGEDKKVQLKLVETDPALGWLVRRAFNEGESIDTRYVEQSSKASGWWQVLAYLVLTIAEILISVTGLELAFVIAPKTMRGFITGIWLATVGVANLFVNYPLARPYEQWTPQQFFGLQLGIMAGVIVAFYFIARRFNRMQAADVASRSEPPVSLRPQPMGPGSTNGP